MIITQNNTESSVTIKFNEAELINCILIHQSEEFKNILLNLLIKEIIIDLENTKKVDPFIMGLILYTNTFQCEKQGRLILKNVEKTNIFQRIKDLPLLHIQK